MESVASPSDLVQKGAQRGVSYININLSYKEKLVNLQIVNINLHKDGRPTYLETLPLPHKCAESRRNIPGVRVAKHVPYVSLNRLLLNDIC